MLRENSHPKRIFRRLVHKKQLNTNQEDTLCVNTKYQNQYRVLVVYGFCGKTPLINNTYLLLSERTNTEVLHFTI